MHDSQDPKQVSSSDLRNAQFGGGLINAESVNAGRIGGDIYNIHLGQQTAVSGSSVQSQNQRERLLSERDSIEKAYTLQSQKVANLRTALVIETDVSRKFQYEHQLQSEERTLKELGGKLDAIEQQLQAFEDSCYVVINQVRAADRKILKEENKPPQIPRITQIKIDNLKHDLNKLAKDYDDVANKKRRESNPQEQNNLQLQLNDITNQMEVIEQQLKESDSESELEYKYE
ncbi:hypothetical protein CDG77_10535 [Nostoc sp. 'Peltigera membranacea cyanobiont' 213]|uniref:hypothetical protein n=1 Tax=Nostoc sp. 'Peltigera membranacea cyanobiont' 213 TaxID=2014530 RepID=UPI000B9575A4|nr:hypothetical protein [Nostoc sp. 'Peltigera membranacea cyanobiont' 213]OYD95154.1 hypothetical protein CDG77_10535 [Nostoc sp. 'Peltigera membranacea cyanobiont' 213]